MMRRFYVVLLFLLSMTVPAGASVSSCDLEDRWDLNNDDSRNVGDVISLITCLLFDICPPDTFYCTQAYSDGVSDGAYDALNTIASGSACMDSACFDAGYGQGQDAENAALGPYVNECLWDHSCAELSSTCVDAVGGYECVCDAGYDLDTDCTQCVEGYNMNASGVCEAPILWDLSGVTTNNINFDFSSNETQTRGFAMSTDGNYMYTVGDNQFRVNQWSLSTPFDVQSASHKTYYGGGSNYPRGIAFKPDGTKMFIVSYGSVSIEEYNLPVPWDLNSVVFVQRNTGYGGNTSSVGLHFSPDGTRMYHGCQTCDASAPTLGTIREYTLSTPWDVSTISFNTWLNIDDGDPTGVVVSSDGRTLWGVGYGSKKVHEFTMSTAWDMSTATPTGITMDVNHGNPFGMSTPQGDKLFIAYDGGKVYEYTGVEGS